MNLMAVKKMFGTSGIRGDASKFFTPSFCFDIGRTFVEFLKHENLLSDIAVGMDPRESSPRIKNDLFKGLVEGGTKLFDEGVTPIPSMNWLTKNSEAKAAVMITGSHIAANLNGVKFYAHDEEISEADERLIEAIYAGLEKKEIGKDMSQITVESRAKDLYRKLLVSLASKHLPHWKVAVDTANGAQTVVMPDLLEELGLTVVRVNCNLDEPFIARDTDTGDKAGIEKLQKVVVSEKCDFGVAYDGDGDRVIFIDEKGNFVQGEYSCCLIARESTSSTIVTTIAASQVVEEIGKTILRTKVGSPYVVGEMKKSRATFGFEPNGGAISAEIQYTRDGGTMTIKILNLFAKYCETAGDKSTFSAMVATLPRFYMERTKVDYPWELQSKILEEAEKNFKGVKVEKLDGLKIWLSENTWMLFRSSQNAPEFRVFAESMSSEKSKKLLADGISLVERIIKGNHA